MQQLTTAQVEILIILKEIQDFDEEQPDNIPLGGVKEILVSSDIMTPKEFDKITETLEYYGYIHGDCELTIDGRQYIELFQEYLQQKTENPKLVNDLYKKINIGKLELNIFKLDNFINLGKWPELLEKVSKGIKWGWNFIKLIIGRIEFMKSKVIISLLGIALLISVVANVFLISNNSNNKDAVSAFSSQLVTADNQINDLKEQVASLGELQEQVIDLQAQLEKSQDAVKELQNQLESYSDVVMVGNGTGDYVEIETEADQLMSEIANQENTDTSGTTATPEPTYQPPQLTEEEKAEMEAEGFLVGDSLQEWMNSVAVGDGSTIHDSGSGIGAGIKLK